MTAQIYPADKFRTARFAEHYDGATARRARHGRWDAGPKGRRRTDAEMARDGWYPVHEHDQSAEETIADLRAMIQMKDDTLDLHRETAKDYRRMIAERDDRIRVLTGEVHEALLTVSLDVLRTAWEDAEVTTDEAPLRRGDTAITQIRPDTYTVESVLADMTMSAPSDVRVLSRAPQREPWQDLEDVLRHEFPEGNQTAMPRVAKQMHAEGWRKTGGDDDA